ncbi:MAG TPA: type II toxin-antitoxin system PemK/MazF family toxin [Cytophagales bacterium]|nr:type II toxin-antitoxin system PemK/MazF family toxin [Cytophagales bacterium]
MTPNIKRGHIWWANLDPSRGTEADKIRPVVIIQTDLLNDVGHPSTIICPVTTNLSKKENILRVIIPKNIGGIDKDSEILIDQIRTIDNTRLTSHIGILPTNNFMKLIESVKMVLDL